MSGRRFYWRKLLATKIYINTLNRTHVLLVNSCNGKVTSKMSFIRDFEIAWPACCSVSLGIYRWGITFMLYFSQWHVTAIMKKYSWQPERCADETLNCKIQAVFLVRELMNSIIWLLQLNRKSNRIKPTEDEISHWIPSAKSIQSGNFCSYEAGLKSWQVSLSNKKHLKLA